MPHDAYKDHVQSLTSPLTRIEAITPSDVADLNVLCRAIVVGTTGDVAVIMADGTSGIIHMVAGITYPVRVSRVLNTGTAATNIAALS